MRINNGFGDTKAIRHRYNDINMYEITDTELDILENGASSDLYLEFAIACGSFCISFVIALCTCDFSNSPKTFNTFLVVSICTGIACVVLCLLWLRTRKSKTQVIESIRKQIVDE